MKPRSRTKVRQNEFKFLNCAGKRRGAGRKPEGKRAGVSHATRPRLSKHEPALVTLRLVAGLPTLRMNDTHERIRHLCSEYHAPDAPFRVVEYSVQSNHQHLLVEANDQRTLSAGMNSFASRLGKRLNRLWRRRGPVLADHYHSEPLHSPAEGGAPGGEPPSSSVRSHESLKPRKKKPGWSPAVPGPRRSAALRQRGSA